MSFNPYRVFSGAATYWWCAWQADGDVFQSLSGFLGRCNSFRPRREERPRFVSIPIGFSRALQPHLSPPKVIKTSFQSLSGFLGRCNLIYPKSYLFDKISFNPYRVFSGAATRICRGRIWPPGKVSIPIGFSRALQREKLSPHNRNFVYVSIPIGFSRALQLWRRFLWRDGRNVSIPIGFSRALQRHGKNEVMLVIAVSIPIGFSRALQLFYSIST